MSGEPRLTALEIRTEVRSECSREFRGALHDCDVDQGDIAAATGAGEAIVQRWADVNRPETIPLVDVVGAARHDRRVAMRMLSWAADKIGARVVEAVTVSASSLLSALTTSVKESGEMHTALLESMADNEVSDAELRRIAAEAGEAERASAAIREAAVQELARRSQPRGVA